MTIKSICKPFTFFFITFFLLFFVFNSVAYAEAADTSIISRIVETFNTKTTAWMGKAQEYAKVFFYWCFVLEIAYLGIRASLSAADMKETLQNFVLAVFTAGFFLAVINNYQEWSNSLIFGLQTAAEQMSGTEKASDNPFKAGLELAKAILAKIDGWSPVDSLAFLLTGLIIIICFALITAQIIMIKCEAMVAMLAACILLGLGATKFFREYAINTIRYVFAVAFKLFTMQLVLSIGYTFIDDIKTSDAEWATLFVIIGFSIILLSLVKTLPDVVSGIINGTHVSSGGALMATVRTVAAAGAMVAGAAIGGAKGMQAVNSAKNVAQAEGAQGFGAVAKGIGKALQSASHQSKMNKTSMGAELKNRLMTLRENN